MAVFNDDYIKSIKESELKLLLPEKLAQKLEEIRSLSEEDKARLFEALEHFVDRHLQEQKKSRGWFRFFKANSKYSIVNSETTPEILANGFKSAMRSLGPDYYNDVQEKASKAYRRQISSKKTPAIWMMKFLAPFIFLKDKVLKKKK